MIDCQKLVSMALELGRGDYRRGLELLAWQNYGAATKLYHVTPVKNTPQIQFAGLAGKATDKVDRGKSQVVWFFVEDTTGCVDNMADELANLLLMNWIVEGCATEKGAEYSLFEINKGSFQDTSTILDPVDEYCALGCFGYKTSKIASSHLKFSGTYWLPLDIDRQTITIDGRKYRPTMDWIYKMVRQADAALTETAISTSPTKNSATAMNTTTPQWRWATTLRKLRAIFAKEVTQDPYPKSQISP